MSPARLGRIDSDEDVHAASASTEPPIDADQEDDEPEPVVAEKTALLVQLNAVIDVRDPIYKVAKQCNLLRGTLRELLGVHFGAEAARTGAMSADDPSAVVFMVTREQFQPLKERYARLIHSFAEISADVHVLSEEQLSRAEKKPKGSTKISAIHGPVRHVVLDEDGDERTGGSPHGADQDDD